MENDHNVAAPENPSPNTNIKRLWILTGITIALVVVGIGAVLAMSNTGRDEAAATTVLSATPSPSFTPSIMPSPTITPSPTPISPTVILLSFQTQDWLETGREVVVMPDLRVRRDRPGPDAITGDYNMSYSANLVVTFGIDFREITFDDIEIDGSKVIIQWPNVQLRDCIIDEQLSEYYDRDCDVQGVFEICDELERELRETALEEIVRYDHSEFLQKADTTARNTLRRWLEDVGGVGEVVFEPDPNPLPLTSANGTCAAYVDED